MLDHFSCKPLCHGETSIWKDVYDGLPIMSDAAVGARTGYGDAPYFIFCDHASNRVPDGLNALGLPDDILQTHIAWDIGARDMTHELARRLSGEAFVCEFSRLVLDPNRDPAADDLIPPTSDQIPIPGNQMLSGDDRDKRIERFHRPYHEYLGNTICAFTDRHASPFVVSIHSYTKRLMGARHDRPWPVGLLWADDPASARSIINFLEGEVAWPVGDNEPYDGQYYDYTIRTHATARNLRHLTFEVRQDWLSDPARFTEIADLLSRGIAHVAQEQSSATVINGRFSSTERT